MAIALSTLSYGLFTSPLDAQEGCEAVAPGNDLTRALTVGELRITYITNPHFLCSGGVEIWADSAEAFPDRGYSHLIGNVRYQEDARELRADDARYFTNEGRLQAEGSLVILDEAQGSSIACVPRRGLPLREGRPCEDLVRLGGSRLRRRRTLRHDGRVERWRGPCQLRLRHLLGKRFGLFGHRALAPA